jgi:cytochrome c oxidase subunit 2
MPRSAAEGAAAVDWLFYLILAISTFFFVVIVTVMLYFVIRYRRREGHKAQQTPSHSVALELTWSLIPAVLLVIIFYVGFKAFMDMTTVPGNAMQVNVIGRRWYWSFEYPNTGLINDSELHVPIDTPISLVLTSEDVIHSLYVPAFRLKRDAVPGRYNKAWFQATEAGEFDLFCAEYCGTAHSDMIAKVIVHPAGEFDVWMAKALQDPIADLTDEQFAQFMNDPETFIAANPELGITMSLAKRGEKLYKTKGCTQCHTVDGSALIGPSLKGLWGAKRQFKDGSTSSADENYIRKSIMDPNDQVVAGYDPVMPTYKGRLEDREITAVIEYIRSLDE